MGQPRPRRPRQHRWKPLRPLATNVTPSSQPAVSPVTAWTTYTDSHAGFGTPIPENLSRNEQTIDIPEKDGYPAESQRLISFVNQSGGGIVGVGVTPNPAGLTLENWIRTYPGWPGDPTTVQIAEEQAVRFSQSVLHRFRLLPAWRFIFELSGGVYGSAEGVMAQRSPRQTSTGSSADFNSTERPKAASSSGWRRRRGGSPGRGTSVLACRWDRRR